MLMGKAKAPKDMQRRRQQSRKRGKRHSTSWMKVIGGGITFLSAVAAVLTLLPRLSVEVSGSRDPHDPLKTVFSLSNDGILPIHDVTPICQVDNWANTAGYSVVGGGKFIFQESHVDILEPTQKISLQCDRVIGSAYPTTRAEFSIGAQYRPDWVWWHRQTFFGFKAQQADDGSWVWRRVPK